MVAGKDGLLAGRDDEVHDAKRSKLAGASSKDGARGNECGGASAGGNVGCTVALPVGQQVAAGHDAVLVHMGRNPSDHDVRALDEAPQVAVDAFRPVVGHGPAAKELKPLLEVEALSDDIKITLAMREPHQGGELGPANVLGAGDPLDSQDAPVLGDGASNGTHG